MSDTRQMYINGGSSAASEGATFKEYNPANGEVWATVADIAHINCSSVNDEPWIPFGGVKGSGLGRHGGSGSVQAFTETRWITCERGGRLDPAPFCPKLP